MAQRLKTTYQETIVPKLKEQFNYTNIHQVPKIIKVTLNRGLGEAATNAKALESSLTEIGLIAGQKPVVTRAKKAIAGFKIREEWPIGCKVTLRSDRMYEFLDRLITIAIPRIRDFRGISPKQFDGRGNFSMGVTEQIIFPEIDYDKVEKIHGMDITLVTTAGRDDLALGLLRAFGWPFRGETPQAVAANPAA